MSDFDRHSKLAKEKRLAAIDEYEKRRYSVVGDLALKAVEQAIEALASKEGKHFHVAPRIARAERVKWAKEIFPFLSVDLDTLWGAYGDLGYDGLDGKRAKDAISAMERIIDEIEKRIGVRLR
ncbi:hypothetical protein KEJ26_07120 [Candidatus Bathyarchaeota archaeon]|nr:hypothetical protein [Candidatus Bathyarchaeota archaeon]